MAPARSGTEVDGQDGEQYACGHCSWLREWMSLDLTHRFSEGRIWDDWPSNRTPMASSHVNLVLVPMKGRNRLLRYQRDSGVKDGLNIR